MKNSLLISFVALALLGCGQKTAQQPAANPPSNASVEVAQKAAEEKLIEDMQYITTKLKTVPSVNKIVVYDENTDPNKLMGRPNQYTAKLNFTDARYPSAGIDFGTIEVFKTQEALENRYAYIDEIGKKMPMLLQYQYKHGNLLMRLDKSLKPSEAKVYEDALKSM